MPQTGEQLRQRYASDPDYRERRKAFARAYAHANRDALRARKIARYDADAAVRERAQDRAAQHRHGVTRLQKEQMVEAQGGVCAACKTDFKYLPERHRHVDHCHRSGTVRGVLCHNCNIALGQVKDSAERLYLLIDYLRRTDPFTPTSGLTFVLETATGQAVTVTAPEDRFAEVKSEDW